MKSSGNSAAQLCASNLLQISRGEVPYERCKGRSPDLIDKPLTGNAARAKADADRMLTIYEPRIDIKKVNLSDILSSEGDVSISADIKERNDV